MTDPIGFDINDRKDLAWCWLELVRKELTQKPQRIFPIIEPIIRTVHAIGEAPADYGFADLQVESVRRECLQIEDVFKPNKDPE